MLEYFNACHQQSECAKAESNLDCTEGYRMIIAGRDVKAPLFFDPSNPPGSFSSGHNNPMPTMFAEPAPLAASLVPFATLSKPDGSTAYYWHGSLTSIDNSWFGIVGGHKVGSCLIYVQSPQFLN